MTGFLPFHHWLRKHLFEEQNNKEQSLWAFFLAFFLSITIGLALGLEYIGGYLPCHLCLIERFPYYSAIPLLILAGFLSWVSKVSSWTRFLFLCVFLLMISSLILAIYHTGVESHLWSAPSSCEISSSRLITKSTQLLDQLNQTFRPSCSEAPTRFLFLSLANWNMIASFFFTLISLYMVSKGFFAHRNTTQTGQ
ncbi:disulfide bond formation protein B [Bartonella sp. F02]|uniref:disulfide bond formation protein B n=1 Tax=Bartonella sp. F02 TaxID=2967262 RepID=UPI0022A934A0|nr:disulfide bond formation protein B [Bartonella sp. F02]MCZ2328849.1 disulfide bond formation protein B [Bartonella sp. F02]